MNCTTGEVRLYKQFNYSIDYILKSPFLIENVVAPKTTNPNEEINVTIQLMPLTTNLANSSIAIFDLNNEKIWESEILTNTTEVIATFYAPNLEGYYEYSVEILDENETLSYYDFSTFVEILKPIVEIPASVGTSQNLDFDFYSYSDSIFTLDVKYYLMKDMLIVQEGDLSKQIIQGSNTQTISLSGMTKENQSYSLLVEMDYLGNKKSENYLLNTNNLPLFFIDDELEFYETQKVVIDYFALDLDSDTLTITINDSTFEKVGDSFEWQTELGDIGNYSVEILVDDGLLNITKVIQIKVSEFPNEAPQVYVFSPADNYTDKDGVAVISCYVSDDLQLSNVSLYADFDGNWSLIETKDLNITRDLVRFRKTINEGSYNFSCVVTDIKGLSSSTDNYTLNVDKSQSIFEFQGLNNEVVASFNGNGDLKLKGNCSENSICTPTNDSLVFLNSNKETTAYIDENGNLCLEGSSCLNYNQTSCNPSQNAFVVHDALMNNLSYIDFNGNMCLTGELIENA